MSFFSGKPGRADELEMGSGADLVEDADEGPNPPNAQLTSTSRLMDHSHVSAKMGVLIRTLRTG